MNTRDVQPESGIAGEIVSLMARIPMFDGLNPEERKTVARQMKIIELASGDVLFEEGDKGHYLCFVVDGALDVLKRSNGAAPIHLLTLVRGGSIGEMSVIDHYPRSATVRAKTPATLVILSSSAFDMLLQRPSSIGIKLLKGIARILSRNLRDTSSALAQAKLPIG